MNEIEKVLDKLYLNFEGAGLTPPEYSDLRTYVMNLQSKIDKINQYIKETQESDSFTVLPSGKKSDIEYCLDALEDIENILKEQ